MLEGCTSFLLDWLIQGHDGLLETNPSTSPEHMFTSPDQKPASVSYSSTMDISIIKEVFSIIISAAEVKLILVLKPILVSYYPNFTLATKFLKNRFWEDKMMLLSKELPSLCLSSLQQKSLGMDPLWNGYEIIFDICIPSSISQVSIWPVFVTWCLALIRNDRVSNSMLTLTPYLFGRQKIFRTQIYIIDMFPICLACFQDTQ